jgi:hypothetical protein
MATAGFLLRFAHPRVGPCHPDVARPRLFHPRSRGGPCHRNVTHTGTTHTPSRFPRVSHVQYPIYFWNIQIQHLQHIKKGKWNTWNMHMKHLQKQLNHCKHTQHPDKNTCIICVKHMQRPDKHICSICLKNRWNIGDKRLQLMCIIIATCATSRSGCQNITRNG